MNKGELVEVIAMRTGAERHIVRNVLDELVRVIRDAKDDEEGVLIPGFGRFRWVDTPERKARNVHTGETIIVPPHKRLSFKASKKLREDA